jgi:hypothetical protein
MGNRLQHEQADDEIVAWKIDAARLLDSAGSGSCQLYELSADAEVCISAKAGGFPDADPGAQCAYRVSGPGGKGGPKWLSWADTRPMSLLAQYGYGKLPTPVNGELFINVRRTAAPTGAPLKYFLLIG